MLVFSRGIAFTCDSKSSCFLCLGPFPLTHPFSKLPPNNAFTGPFHSVTFKGKHSGK